MVWMHEIQQIPTLFHALNDKKAEVRKIRKAENISFAIKNTRIRKTAGKTMTWTCSHFAKPQRRKYTNFFGRVITFITRSHVHIHNMMMKKKIERTSIIFSLNRKIELFVWLYEIPFFQRSLFLTRSVRWNVKKKKTTGKRRRKRKSFFPYFLLLYLETFHLLTLFHSFAISYIASKQIFSRLAYRSSQDINKRFWSCCWGFINRNTYSERRA